MNDREAEGKTQKVTGKIKQAAGILIGDADLEQRGAADRAEGSVREGIGKAQRKLGEAVENLGEAIKKK